MGPLNNIRVLDMSRVLAGPWAGQIFADLGADVIKIERPGQGDDTRAWGPPYLQDAAGRDTSEAGYYLSANRGKRSVTVDITKPEGQAIIRELASKCDVLIENYKVGGLKKYALDYAALQMLNPRLIYCSITGFGQTGPYAERAGYDFMIQGMGGIMSVTGERADKPGGGPQKIGVALADVVTGLYSVIAVQAALLHREQSGLGQYIDMALLDCQVAVMANQALNYLVSGRTPQRLGNAHPNIVPYQGFESADGHLIIAVGNDAQFARLAKLLERPEWAGDSRFASNAARVRHRETLVSLLEPLIRSRPTEAWLQALDAEKIPCGPINDLQQVFADPQVQHRGMRIETPHPLAGSVPLVASPMKFSLTPVVQDQPPPLLGEHTDEVLRELLDCTPETLAAWRAAGVI